MSWPREGARRAVGEALAGLERLGWAAGPLREDCTLTAVRAGEDGDGRVVWMVHFSADLDAGPSIIRCYGRVPEGALRSSLPLLSAIMGAADPWGGCRRG